MLIVNGHGGNSFAAERVEGDSVRWHDWWRSERVRALLDELDRTGSHASWTENFPWTRLAGVALPDALKPPVEQVMETTDPVEFRRLAGDGSFGGFYERPDDEMLRIWEAAVEEVRELLEAEWPA